MPHPKRHMPSFLAADFSAHAGPDGLGVVKLTDNACVVVVVV